MVETSTDFGQLTDMPLRDAWPDEARSFTPWLHDNIAHLSDAVGLDLEAIDKEVNVDGFSADIIATVVGTDERVLIENQLENSDHRHLGQILTYLAGMGASAVVWIAREFHEAHRSAISWLNEHTAHGFAFFAVRLRVVRIGDSPLAPVFEVVERPNTWERKLARGRNEATSELTRLREAFWNQYLARHPGVFKPSRAANVWISMLRDRSVYLSMYLAARESGMFLRGGHGADPNVVAEWMAKHKADLDEAFGASESTAEGYYYPVRKQIAWREEESWNGLIDWMEGQRARYAAACRAIETGLPRVTSEHGQDVVK